MRLEAGSRLGPYEISGPLGAGGMGEVYRARDTRLGREVAIKVLPHDLSNDRDRLARFEREARSASALNHRNIVTIHDFTSQDGEAWLVMELIRGESLRDLIDRGPIPPKKILSIAIGIADGLAAAHAPGLVHRDLKPENLMITSDGTAKILDFGLVKDSPVAQETNAPTTPQVSHSGLVLGTASYMSPEQARGEDVDFRTDQFSFGLILYEMATGKNPFRRATPMDTIAAILNEDMPPLGEPLGWIVERCLRKNREERYGSTADLAHDLRRLRDHPVVAARGRQPMHWWPVIAVAATLAAIVVVLMSRRQVSLQPMEVAVALSQVVHVNLREISSPIAISPDGRYVVIDGSSADGTSRLWLHDLHSGTTRPIPASENAFGFTWSPDSRSIAYCAGGKLKTTSIDGSPPRILCDAAPPGMPTWSGDTIVFSTLTGISRISTRGGSPQSLVRKDPSRPADALTWPQVLPDGTHFLYISVIRRNEQIDHDLMAASLDGSEPKRITSMDSRVIFANGRLLYVRDGTLLAQPFDAKALRFTGEPQPLLDDIHYFRSTGLAAFSVSNNGLLVWRAARRPSREAWLDRSGLEVASIASGVFGSGRLSPDGMHYAVGLADPKQGTSDIWIYDLSRQNVERLTFQLTLKNNPVWSPDGRTIYYLNDVLGPPDIFRWKLGEDRGVPFYRGAYVEQPEDVSPDGKWLLFVQYSPSFTGHIMVLPIDHPVEARPLAVTQINEWSPRFSADGKWVAYQSDLSGRPEVYVRSFAGSASTTRISRDGGTRPRWRSDGKELFFLGPGGTMMRVAMSDGTSTSAPTILFHATNAVDFEPSRDGSRFLTQIEERTTEPTVHLLINWPARLNAQ